MVIGAMTGIAGHFHRHDARHYFHQLSTIHIAKRFKQSKVHKVKSHQFKNYRSQLETRSLGLYFTLQLK